MLKTKFWRNAANSLPKSVRARYLSDIEQAERLELALDGAIELRPVANAARRALTPGCLADRAASTPTSSSSG
jgi:hypothetical protein